MPLFHTLGNYCGWKAKAIGANNQAAQSILKTDYKVDETDLGTHQYPTSLVILKAVEKEKCRVEGFGE
jgi:20S proteasome alpha/beta subunit